MTTNENPQNPHLSPLMADILTANAKWSEGMTNQVLDSKDREIQLWQSKFLTLFELIEGANKYVDSARIDRILCNFSYDAERAARGLDSK